MNANRRHEGGDRGTGQVQRHRSTSEEDFCWCGLPYVRPRGGGRRVCVEYRHPEPLSEVLVRSRSGRPWWQPVGEPTHG